MWPHSTHINDSNMSLGVLRPVEIYVVIECVEMGHTSSLWPLSTHSMMTYVPRGLSTQSMMTYVPRSPRTPRDI